MTNVIPLPIRFRRCMATPVEGRCTSPAVWTVVLTCYPCGNVGKGLVCSYHREQAEYHGVPHPRCSSLARVTRATQL